MNRLLIKYKKDLILIGCILILALTCLSVFIFTAKNGETVKVIIDGKEKYTYDLTKDTKAVIFTEENDKFQNTMVIEEGKVFMDSANCPDKICVSHRAISKKGQTIVCLPHKLVIAIE